MTTGAYAATLLALFFWAFLALAGSFLNHLPALLVTGLSLCIGGLIGIFRFREWKVPIKTFAVGIWGILFYHLCFFSAFKFAPAVSVNLVNYLWPLLLVLLSPVFFKNCRLTGKHLLAALLGFSGAVLIIGGDDLAFSFSGLTGYMMAAAAAFVWSTYSLLTKKVAPFPTAAVGGFCLVSGMIALAICWGQHGNLPLSGITLQDAGLIVFTGICPMGLSFYFWDYALKNGDPRVIGSLSYLEPLLSTFVLVFAGGRTFTAVHAVAMLCIVTGAFLGAGQANSGNS